MSHNEKRTKELQVLITQSQHWLTEINNFHNKNCKHKIGDLYNLEDETLLRLFQEWLKEYQFEISKVIGVLAIKQIIIYKNKEETNGELK